VKASLHKPLCFSCKSLRGAEEADCYTGEGPGRREQDAGPAGRS